MTKSAMICTRIEPELKQAAESVFKSLGLSASQAIAVFYRQSVLQNGLPFEVRLPLKEAAAGVLPDRTDGDTDCC